MPTYLPCYPKHTYFFIWPYGESSICSRFKYFLFSSIYRYTHVSPDITPRKYSLKQLVSFSFTASTSFCSEKVLLLIQTYSRPVKRIIIIKYLLVMYTACNQYLRLSKMAEIARRNLPVSLLHYKLGEYLLTPKGNLQNFV